MNHTLINEQVPMARASDASTEATWSYLHSQGGGGGGGGWGLNPPNTRGKRTNRDEGLWDGNS